MILIETTKKPDALTRHVMCIAGFKYSAELGWHAASSKAAAAFKRLVESQAQVHDTPDEQLAQTAWFIKRQVDQMMREIATELEEAADASVE